MFHLEQSSISKNINIFEHLKINKFKIATIFHLYLVIMII